MASRLNQILLPSLPDPPYFSIFIRSAGRTTSIQPRLRSCGDVLSAGSSPTSSGPDLRPSSSQTLPYAGTYPIKWYVSSSSSLSACCSFSLPLLFLDFISTVVLARFAGGGFASLAFFSFALRFSVSKVVMVKLLMDARISDGLHMYFSNGPLSYKLHIPSQGVMCRTYDRKICDR